jgi:hypothetical protein
MTAVGDGMAEVCWLRQLLVERHSPLSRATLVYCDNISVVYLSTNPVQHQRTKHVEIDLHFVRERVAVGGVHVLHVDFSVHRHLHQGAALLSVLRVSVQSQHLQWLEFRLWGVLENSCIRGPLGCMCIGLLGLMWAEAQPLDYIIVILLFESIEQPL